MAGTTNVHIPCLTLGVENIRMNVLDTECFCKKYYKKTKITCFLPRPPPSPAQATQASAGTAPPLAFTQLTQSESLILFSESLCCPQEFSIWVIRDQKWQGTTSQGTRCSCEYNVSTAPPLAFTQLTQSERLRLLLHVW